MGTLLGEESDHTTTGTALKLNHNTNTTHIYTAQNTILLNQAHINMYSNTTQHKKVLKPHNTTVESKSSVFRKTLQIITISKNTTQE